LLYEIWEDNEARIVPIVNYQFKAEMRESTIEHCARNLLENIISLFAENEQDEGISEEDLFDYFQGEKENVVQGAYVK